MSTLYLSPKGMEGAPSLSRYQKRVAGRITEPKLSPPLTYILYLIVRTYHNTLSAHIVTLQNYTQNRIGEYNEVDFR